ncbi:MAG TPA: PQQ-binding-like beta-propeller repeat protein [Cyclobacteriaceae bacterium]|nr:PQQ-binding-like beta-propeller repeat protein [Cyclobacteriaceae bacterium]
MKKLALIAAFGLLISCKDRQSPSLNYNEWKTYAGTKEGNRYSSNEEINLQNVAQLKVAWTFSSNDKDPDNHSQNQCNPIVVDGILYGTSPQLKLLALDAATGKSKWIFDPLSIDTAAKKDRFAYFKVNRGVVYWQDETGTDKRILYSAGSKIFAINITDGKRISDFGKSGYIDLTENLDRDAGTYNPFVTASSPGIIYKDIFITGHRVGETADAAPGPIRAYDVRTGQLKWMFHTIPHPGEKGIETWEDKDAWKKFGGANSWAGMSLDEQRGIVYVPTGSIGGDFYGGIRKGQNLFSSSLIALDASTGKYRWHYQVVHHDLWDRDLAATPNLVTLNINGKKIDAVAQTTKHGYIFVFNRETGEPLFPIEEKPFPASDLPGEESWPTQPIPTLPEPFARQKFSAEDVSNIDSETHKEMLEKFNLVKYGNMFTPPSKEGVWIFPGFDGGGEWGGAAVDPESGIMYVNSSELPWALTMVDVPKDSDHSLKGIGRMVYAKNCMACHGANMKGNGSSFPSLVGLNKKYKADQAWKIIENGKNMMPAFKQIKGTEKEALLALLFDLQDKEPVSSNSNNKSSDAHSLDATKSIMDEVPFMMTGYNRFLDKNGYPGITPPWGTLNAVNLNTGKLLWKVTLGEFPELTKKGIPPTGTENYGGPLVTKGGLVFIAATKDEMIRAFDKSNGKVVWEHQLPAAGYATPATYSVNGKQYVVIACGGGKIGSKSGDSYVAFALP